MEEVSRVQFSLATPVLKRAILGLFYLTENSYKGMFKVGKRLEIGRALRATSLTLVGRKGVLVKARPIPIPVFN